MILLWCVIKTYCNVLEVSYLGAAEFLTNSTNSSARLQKLLRCGFEWQVHFDVFKVRRMWSGCCSLSSKEQWITQILLHRRLVLLFFLSWWSFGVRLSFHKSLAAATNSETWVEHGMLFLFSGGKDGPVGFADFVYKHIVPACFLAPLKQTFDLADAQTVLVCITVGLLVVAVVLPIIAMWQVQ